MSERMTALLDELAGTWEVMAELEQASKEGRRETLRECADGLRTLADIVRKAERLAPQPKTDRESVLEELLRSACAIAERQGAGTAWDRFAASVRAVGLNGITARTYRVLPSDEPAPQAEPADAMTFDKWWDTTKTKATPETYAGWEHSCRQAWNAARKEVERLGAAFEDECNRTDSLLTILGVPAEQCRSEGGSLMPHKVLTLMGKKRADQVAEPVAVGELPPLLTHGEIRSAVIDYLATQRSDALWKAFTYDTGPYEVTELRADTLGIARAIERKVRAALASAQKAQK